MCLAQGLRQLLGTAGQVVHGTILGGTHHMVTEQICHENFPVERNFRKGCCLPIHTKTHKSWQWVSQRAIALLVSRDWTLGLPDSTAPALST